MLLQVGRRPGLTRLHIQRAVIDDDLRVAERGAGAPCAHAHLHRPAAPHSLGSRHAPGEPAAHHAGSHMVGEELLHPVAGRAECLCAIEAYHVGVPLAVVLIDEDGRVAAHAHDVGIVLHTHHEDRLAQCRIHVARLPIVLRHGIFAGVDDRPLPVIMVKPVVLPHKPLRGAVIMLVDNIHRMVIAPAGMVGAPRLHIAYALHLGEAGLDGIVEEAVSLGVMIALV